MRKKLIMLLISVCLLMSLASCKNDKNTDSEANGRDSSEMKEAESFDGLIDQGTYTVEVGEDDEGGFAPN